MSKTKIAHITLLDQYHPGIYDSQVLDVCRHLEAHHEVQIQLIAFLSIRELRHTSAKKNHQIKVSQYLGFTCLSKVAVF